MRTSLLLGALGVATLLPACSPGKKAYNPNNVGPTVVAPQNTFLRNAFDTDPSFYIGRFVPRDAAAIDESSAMQLTCSQHVSYRKVDGGGVIYDELFNASTEAALRVGVPLIANVDASGGQSQVIRVRYELTDKMVAVLDDPAAFEACCKQAPDQCTDRYIGEFIGGTGAVFYSKDAGGGGSAGVVLPQQGITGDLEFRHGMAWQRSIEFPRPVYFAFKTTENRWAGATDGIAGCGTWTDAPPRSSQGRYFVGLSMPLPTEAEARSGALQSGREQVVRYIAEGIETNSLSVRVTSGSTSALSSQLEDQAMLTSAASGVARLVKDEAWCVESQATPGGPVYVAKALMFLPKSEELAAARAVTGGEVEVTSDAP